MNDSIVHAADCGDGVTERVLLDLSGTHLTQRVLALVPRILMERWAIKVIYGAMTER